MDFLEVFIFTLCFQIAFQNQVIIDCHPDKNPTQSKCRDRGCYWQPSPDPKIPVCVFPENVGYNLQQNIVWNENTLSGRLKRIPTPSLFGNDFVNLKVAIRPISKTTFHVLIQDARESAQRVPHAHVRRVLLDERSNFDDDDAELELIFDKAPFGFGFVRKSTGKIIFDTRKIPGFTFAEQFLQISIGVPSQYVYGLGEMSYTRLKHDFQWRKLGLFAQDYGPDKTAGMNLYSVHPFYLCVEDDQGNSHGVLFLNSHAMDVFLQPDPDIITFRAIGGSLELFVCAGPSPNQVIEQYTALVGRPNMPPQWALGFQLSRFGYRNLTYLRRVFDRNQHASIPQDVQFIDDDYMRQALDFTVDKRRFGNLSDFVEELHTRQMKLVLLVDPAISSQPNVSNYTPLMLGLKMDVFIKDNRTGEPLEGRVWPGRTFWPDFSKRQTAKQYWTKLLSDFHRNVKFDGVWIDMNEPSNFENGSLTGCVKNKFNNPPYNPLIYDNIYHHTICLDSEQFAGKHYSMHNLYGYNEAEATYEALRSIFPKKRPFILSRSTFVGSGKFTNHWTGDNQSKWDHMRYSIISILLFQMFGIPMTGADICGFFGEATEELCLRWGVLGAFYPYSRNHNEFTVKQDQDPAAWSTETISLIRRALEYRYQFLPYLYTLFYHAHMKGHPVARPLFFEFSADMVSRNVDDQFLWGDSLMIVPILQPNTTKRYAYFPYGNWYDDGGFEYPGNTSSARNISVDLDDNLPVGLYIRGGRIVPFQDSAKTTFQTRLNPYSLIVAFEHGKAKGDLFIDDGESAPDPETGLHFHSTFITFRGLFTGVDPSAFGFINITCHRNNYHVLPPLTTINIVGGIGHPTYVKVDYRKLRDDQIMIGTNVVKLNNLFLDLNSNHFIIWESYIGNH